MMAGLTRILSLICVAGCHLSSASPVLRSALVVPVGKNVSLTCNVTSSGDITWYRLRSDQLLPLLTVTMNKLRDVTVQPADGRFIHRGDLEGGPVILEIQEVEQEDGGLYFCSGRCGAAVCVDRGIHLLVGGVDEDTVWQPCWSLGICVLPAVLLLLCLIFIGGFYLCPGQPAVCSCNPERSYRGQKVTEEASLHYSSLKHAYRPRPSSPGGTGLVNDNVTYSAVTNCSNPNGSHDLR